jgi:hypothetical protein
MSSGVAAVHRGADGLTACAIALCAEGFAPGFAGAAPGFAGAAPGFARAGGVATFASGLAGGAAGFAPGLPSSGFGAAASGFAPGGACAGASPAHKAATTAAVPVAHRSRHDPLDVRLAVSTRRTMQPSPSRDEA